MHTWVYKGLRKDNAYLYITAKDRFDQVPDALLTLLGKLELVLDLNLTEDRRLAQVETKEVMRQLDREGYYLQLPSGDQKPEKIC
jgi:uncharacterized protein YcgL (UPF0745 family)